MAKNLGITVLLDVYGNLITDKQRDFLYDYYNEDLSLSEIAENSGISRQGVRDAVKRAENQLLEFEEKLGFIRRSREISSILDEIRDCAEQIYNENLNGALSPGINDLTVRIKSLCNDIDPKEEVNSDGI